MAQKTPFGFTHVLGQLVPCEDEQRVLALIERCKEEGIPWRVIKAVILDALSRKSGS